MEDDDEFGDLYTDVLRPLSATSQPHQASPALSSLHRPIDLNINSIDQDSPHRVSVPNSTPPQTLKLESQLPSSHAATRAYKDSEFTDNNDVKVDFDIEEEGHNGILNDDDGAGFEIPGISQNDVVIKGEGQNERDKREDVVGEEKDEDDWESDSEDDLQILLNEENHRPMLIDDGGGNDDDDDEDRDPLVILADGDAGSHQIQGLMVKEQEGGADDAAAQMGAGTAEKEGMGERANGAAAGATSKIGYSNHFAYHNTFHSQYKVSVV